MKKVYFSNKENPTKWDNSWGKLKVFIYPKNILSFNGWKMAIMFMKDFECYFLEEEK